MEKEFLKISQNSQENTCVESSFLKKLQKITLIPEHLQTTVFLNCKFLQHNCFLSD